MIPLGKVTLFRLLSDDALVELENLCVCRSYNAGQEILGQSEDDDEVYFVLSGRATAKIYSVQGRVVGFRTIEAGGIFGEFAAIDRGQRSASIEAEEDCTVAVLQGPDFRELVAKEHAVSEALMRHLVGEIRSLVTRVFEFSTLVVNARIQAEVLRLAMDQGIPDKSVPGSLRIENPPTHAEIAGRISTHREAVTRQFKYLMKERVIEKLPKALLIRDMKRLKQMVSDARGE